MEGVERFKYLFPFYRTDIKAFAKKMESIKEGIDAASKDTKFVKIEHVK